MNRVEAIHTLARRYCMEMYGHWSESYSKLAAQGRDRSGDGYNYTEEALNIFPRYQVLSAILVEVESLLPADLRTVGAAKELLCLAGRTAESIFTKSPHSAIQSKAMEEEREAFCRYVLGATRHELEGVEPLFYRRVLTPKESGDILGRLRNEWGVGRWYWYPLADSKRGDVLAVQDKYFYEELGVERLRSILAACGLTKVWELREVESEPEYEMELSAFEPYYSGAEGYWCYERMDWVIYASHESSVTLGGAWLIEEVKKVWKNWPERVWTSPFFD
jgi:hypothetical protein